MNHVRLDRRSLEFGRRIAARLRADPALLDVARGNLRRWQSRPGTGDALRRCYSEWEVILATQEAGEIAALLEREDEEAARLRQNSPFAGVLDAREVWTIKREFADAA